MNDKGPKLFKPQEASYEIPIDFDEWMSRPAPRYMRARTIERDGKKISIADDQSSEDTKAGRRDQT